MAKILKSTLVTRTRLFPEAASPPSTTPLSILDATTVRFAPTSAIWIYHSLDLSKRFTHSLQLTINQYPQWTGRLHFSDYDPQSSNHTKRYGRLALSYGFDTDPGIEYIFAKAEGSLEELIPSQKDKDAGYWRADVLPLAALIDEHCSPLALGTAQQDQAPLPCVIIQVTQFVSGEVAIVLKLAHPLADAHTMIEFVKLWASLTRGEALCIQPLFKPSLLDDAASGDIDLAISSSKYLAISGALPVARYDWWASPDGAPSWAKQPTTVPLEVLSTVESMGRKLPWNDWDLSKKQSYCHIFFTKGEIHRIWEAVSATSQERLSHLDTLMAHILVLIAHAQDLERRILRFYYTLDLRTRVSPALPPEFVGSTIMLTEITFGPDVSGHRVGKVAETIRRTVSKFTTDTVPSLLHEKAYEVSLQRRWDAFLGTGHCIGTSWIRQGAYDIDFGFGKPHFLDAIIPDMEGCLHIIDGPCSGSKEWWEGSVTIGLTLSTEAMDRLLEDPTLRQYRVDPDA